MTLQTNAVLLVNEHRVPIRLLGFAHVTDRGRMVLDSMVGPFTIETKLTGSITIRFLAEDADGITETYLELPGAVTLGLEHGEHRLLMQCMFRRVSYELDGRQPWLQYTLEAELLTPEPLARGDLGWSGETR